MFSFSDFMCTARSVCCTVKYSALLYGDSRKGKYQFRVCHLQRELSARVHLPHQYGKSRACLKYRELAPKAPARAFTSEKGFTRCLYYSTPLGRRTTFLYHSHGCDYVLYLFNHASIATEGSGELILSRTTAAATHATF